MSLSLEAKHAAGQSAVEDDIWRSNVLLYAALTLDPFILVKVVGIVNPPQPCRQRWDPVRVYRLPEQVSIVEDRRPLGNG